MVGSAEAGTALQLGIEREEMVLVYQPVRRLDDGSVQGAEALVRWMRPELGQVAPDDFIPLAEATGLIVPLGEWVLGEALRQLTEWRRSASVPDDFQIAVNLSPRQLEDPELVDSVARLLDFHEVEPSGLILELTESVPVADADSVARVAEIAATGVSISIDDFGTGYASFAHLRRLPARQLKADRSFVAGLLTSPVDAALVGTLISLAHDLGMTCVAEGVETLGQLELLRELGCDLGQGYLLGRPAPAVALTPAELILPWVGPVGA
ncbi:EAL domain-containing protein [Naasia sp.]|uniref:putative bifunctional diguanylate cyclase/phosphodiesterase n=1 Tax=Naasia sp. TaxID=2546198 RepID=UPI002615B2F8|nr:EAL domain-containing protein [Naasia sp.]